MSSKRSGLPVVELVLRKLPHGQNDAEKISPTEREREDGAILWSFTNFQIVLPFHAHTLHSWEVRSPFREMRSEPILDARNSKSIISNLDLSFFYIFIILLLQAIEYSYSYHFENVGVCTTWPLSHTQQLLLYGGETGGVGECGNCRNGGESGLGSLDSITHGTNETITNIRFSKKTEITNGMRYYSFPSFVPGSTRIWALYFVQWPKLHSSSEPSHSRRVAKRFARGSGYGYSRVVLWWIRSGALI